MELARAIAAVISSTVLIMGIGFTLIQLRHMRAARERGAMLELVHRLQTTEFARAMRMLFDIHGNSSKVQISDVIKRDPGLIYELLSTWESLGIMVYRREMSLDMVDDFFSGPILISWSVLEEFVYEERKRLQRDTTWEWFQWLAERMKEQEQVKPPVPAYIITPDPKTRKHRLASRLHIL